MIPKITSASASGPCALPRLIGRHGRTVSAALARLGQPLRIERQARDGGERNGTARNGRTGADGRQHRAPPDEGRTRLRRLRHQRRRGQGPGRRGRRPASARWRRWPRSSTPRARSGSWSPPARSPRAPSHDVADALEKGDAIIDGGNSHYLDDIRRSEEFAEKGIDYIDCGTSGGVWGLERGYCLMIGGPDGAVERLDPIFASVAPGVGEIDRTPGREGDPSPSEQGYLPLRPRGGGPLREDGPQRHRVRADGRLRRGPQHHPQRRRGQAERDADAETAPLEHPEHYQYEIDISEVAEVWRRGSVVASWLLDLAAWRCTSPRPWRSSAAASATPARAAGPRWPRSRRASRPRC